MNPQPVLELYPRRGLLRGRRQYGWRLKAAGFGEVVAHGEGYYNSADNEATATLVAVGGHADGDVELYRRRGLLRGRRQWGWRLKATNGEVVASGEGYYNRTDAQDMADRVRLGEFRHARIVWAAS